MTEAEEQEPASSLPLMLFTLGFLLMFAGVVVLVISSLVGGDGAVSGGAVVFVGPIPILIGDGPHGFLAVVLAAVLTIIGFVVFFWMRRRASKDES